VQFDDDDRFEKYLRGFRPLDPVPLRIERSAPSSRSLRSVGVCIAAAALFLITVGLARTLEWSRPQAHTVGIASEPPEQIVGAEPLTAGSSTALLAASTSWKEAVDSIAFRIPIVTLPKGYHSALTALSKERIAP
jgi:hypothetical protein